ncbi:hypothetical protein K7X08_035674 [Anisodus acutangulus]|uniref:Uncharacterized protein n=1 Tax=Anisodus acutangulus TaxID=402998 RepID=A0A9Q1MC81_9SOLA|nr:hypothetical protein K7X08_035674 [Anisodus acutangulus]
MGLTRCHSHTTTPWYKSKQKIQIEAGTLERFGSGGDVGSLREDLRHLMVVVQVVQAQDHVILEDPTLMTHEDISASLRVENLIYEEDSPTYIKGKRKYDETDLLGDEIVEVTRTRLREEEENVQIVWHKSIFDIHSIPLTSETMGASSNRIPPGVTLPQPLPLPVLEPVVADVAESREAARLGHLK